MVPALGALFRESGMMFAQRFRNFESSAEVVKVRPYGHENESSDEYPTADNECRG